MIKTKQEIDAIRKNNKKEIKECKIFVPQFGFQEAVLSNNADILISGGSRGSGKSYVLLMGALPQINFTHFSGVIMRREKDDFKRGGGLWQTSDPLYSLFGTKTETNNTWTFPSGATIKFEHLSDEGKVDQRFRGAQLTYIGIDEINQITEESFWMLLSSNRNAHGLKTRIIGTCNPDPDSWVRRMIDWYIGEDGFPIMKRSGVIRYFYKYGSTIDEIIWGNSREEVYQKAKYYIDKLMSKDLDGLVSPLDFVKSLAFIKGDVSENKILLENDKGYVANIAQGGEESSSKELLGNWNVFENKSEMLSAYDFKERLYNNTPQTTGIKYITADIALGGDDKQVIIVWDGFHIIDILSFDKLSGMEAKDTLISTARKYKIPNHRICFDANGIGSFLNGKGTYNFIPNSIAFKGGNSPTDKTQYFNSRSETYACFVNRIIEHRGYSIDKDLLKRIVNGKTIEDHLLDERRVIRTYQKGINWREIFRLIPKEDMKKIIGHSPDFMDAITMREYIETKKVSLRCKISY